MSDITNYENLANAVILQAVKDYRMALKCLERNPKNRIGVRSGRIFRFIASEPQIQEGLIVGIGQADRAHGQQRQNGDGA